MADFVFVPGTNHGGWSFQPMTDRLREHGHRVFPLTLTGVAERVHLASGTVNLDTHIDDVVRVLEAEEITDAVLVGHSYGGMVIAGAADRAADWVDAAVFLDAVVPQDGESCWDLVPSERDWYLSVGEDGYSVPPMPFFDPRATAHPLGTLLQKVRMTGDLSGLRRRDFVYATGWEGESPFVSTYERLLADPAWHVHALDGRHNLMRDASEELLKVLLSVVQAS